MRCSDNSFHSIAVTLNQEDDPSSRTLYYQRKGTDNPNHENGCWNESGVQGIVRNEVYIWNMVQNKKGTLFFKSSKLTAKDEWIRVENTHEPLIDQKTWNIVCELDAKHFRLRKPKDDILVSIFTGLLKCADCGFNMHSLIERRTNKAEEEVRYVSFMCNNYSRNGKSVCAMHSISDRRLKTLVLEEIGSCAKLANEDEDALIQQMLMGNYSVELEGCK